MKDLPVYKITIDDIEDSGIEYVSLVEKPAIMIKGLAFSDNVEPQYFTFNDDKQIIAGAALIPDLKIYRYDVALGEYYVVFEKETIEKMVDKFNKTQKEYKINLEHSDKVVPAFIKGSWIIEDMTNDKSRMYGFTDLPIGTWFIEVKIEDKEFWYKEVRGNNRTGFSIEGLMGLTLSSIKNKFEILQGGVASSNVASYRWNSTNNTLILTFHDGSRYKYYTIDREEFENIILGDAQCITSGENEFGRWFEGKSPSVGAAVWEYLRDTNIRFEKLSEMNFESYDDYPKAAQDNACKVLRWIDEYGRDEVDGMTRVGLIRANQLCNGEKISEDTISRMSGFQRHRENSEISEEYKATPWKDRGYVAWLGWGGTEGIEWAQRKLQQIRQEMAVGIPHYTKDGKLWTGATHTDADGRLMTGEVHTEDSEYLYHYEELAEVGERGAIKESDKAPKSDTPNPNPQGEGTAKGDASSTRGAEVTERVEKILKEKSDDFNKRYKDKLGYGVNVGMLKSVYQRGVGAYNVSHSPNVNSAEQWALARVNAFLYIVKTGRPENKKYVGDNDLLPTEHPKKEKLTINKKTELKMKKNKLIFRDYKLQNGATITIDGDMAIGSYVYLLGEDGSREQAPEGEHILEDGTTIFVDAEGYINEIRTAATTDTTQRNENLQVTPEEIMAVVNPMFEEMRMVIAELQSRLEMLEGKTDAAADILQVEDEMKNEKFSQISSKINKIRTILNK